MNRTFHLALIFLVLSNLLSTNLFSQNENNDSTIISFTTDQITELSKIPYEWISYQGKINIINEDNKEMSAQFFFANKIDSIIYFNLHLSGKRYSGKPDGASRDALLFKVQSLELIV